MTDMGLLHEKLIVQPKPTYPDYYLMVRRVLEEMREDFPFERVDWDHGQCLRLKGYHNTAINPRVAEVLENWFKRWFGVDG